MRLLKPPLIRLLLLLDREVSTSVEELLKEYDRLRSSVFGEQPREQVAAESTCRSEGPMFARHEACVRASSANQS